MAHKKGVYTASHSPLEKSKSHILHLSQGSHALVAQEDPTLWHARFGHLNYNSLQKLSSSQLVEGLPIVLLVFMESNIESLSLLKPLTVHHLSWSWCTLIFVVP